MKTRNGFINFLTVGRDSVEPCLPAGPVRVLRPFAAVKCLLCSPRFTRSTARRSLAPPYETASRRSRFCAPLTFVIVLVASFLTSQVLAQGESTNFWKNLPKGPQVHGYFEGRSPCREIMQMFGVPAREECIKIKWQLVLFQDPVTKVPTTYALGGFQWRNPPKTGKWAIMQGTKEDPNAVVIQLDPEQPQSSFAFQKADENILLFLDRERRLMVGNSRFSYTLNRVNKP